MMDVPEFPYFNFRIVFYNSETILTLSVKHFHPIIYTLIFFIFLLLKIIVNSKR